MKKLNTLLALLLMPLAALAGEYRAIVEAKAMTDHPLHAGPDDKVLHVYQPGDAVKAIDPKPCSAAACEVKVPSGEQAWVLSYKVTSRADLAAEQESYKSVPWDSMSDSDVFRWAIQKDHPAFGYACAMALAGGELEDFEELEPLCRKVRGTREIQEAVVAAEDAMKAMDQEDRQKMLNGGAPIGAPKGAAYVAWGKPRDTQRTITKDVIAEQLIYKNRVAFIENGILTMIQE